MKVAVYRRTDSGGQTEFSLLSQLDKIRKYCDENNMQIGAIYTDAGFSGINMERPELMRLLSDSECSLFDAVVVYDLSRLTRNVSDYFTIKETLRGKGVNLIICSEPIDGNIMDVCLKNIQEAYIQISKDKARCRRRLS